MAAGRKQTLSFRFHLHPRLESLHFLLLVTAPHVSLVHPFTFPYHLHPNAVSVSLLHAPFFVIAPHVGKSFLMQPLALPFHLHPSTVSVSLLHRRFFVIASQLCAGSGVGTDVGTEVGSCVGCVGSCVGAGVVGAGVGAGVDVVCACFVSNLHSTFSEDMVPSW